jgi:hypothetical protein
MDRGYRRGGGSQKAVIALAWTRGGSHTIDTLTPRPPLSAQLLQRPREAEACMACSVGSQPEEATRFQDTGVVMNVHFHLAPERHPFGARVGELHHARGCKSIDYHAT